MAGTTISDLGKLLAQNTQSVQGTDNTTRSTNAKVDFGTMMKQTNNRQTAAYADVNHNETVKTAASGKDTNTVSDNYQKYQYKDNTIASETKQVTSDDTVKEQLEQFTKDVKEVLKEELGVTDEAIEAAMQTLGLQFQDLLNQNNLANLVAELTGADSVQQLLCSEQFVNVLQSVNDIGKDVLNALGMNVEEFQKAVALAADDTVANVEETVSQDNTTSSLEPEQTAIADTAARTPDITVEDKRQTKAVENAPVKEQTEVIEDTAQSDVAEDVSEQEIIPKAQNLENETEDSGEQKNTSDTDSSFKFTKGNVPAANETVVTPQHQVAQEITNVETAEPLPQTVNTQDVIDQIVESARVILTEDKTSMELQLNPQNLGKIILKVTEQEGAVTAKIMTQNAVVKEALEAQTVELRQNLEQAGVKVDAVEVTVASHEFEKNLEQNAEGEKQQGEQQEKEKGRTRRLNLNDLSELSGVMSEEETLAAKMMAEQGNSVDYTA